MLHFNLGPIFAARNITRPRAFLIKAGFNNHSANNVLSGDYPHPRMQHIELLCKLLVCTPNDLFVWKKDANEIVADNHPLHQLAPKRIPTVQMDKLRNLPLEQLTEVTNLINEALTKKEE